MKSTQSFSKSKMLSLPFVLGLMLTASASPIPHSRLSRRNEQPQGCPGTLRGPSGNAYFAFSTNLNNDVAKEACASCYGGILANVGYSDLQFLGANLEQPSWIKSWNGDDYSNSCLTIQPSGGAGTGVGVDGACATQNWPLCQAASDIPDSFSRIEGNVVTLNSLAIAYTPSQEAPVAEANKVVVTASETVTLVPVSDTTDTTETTDDGAETAEKGFTVSAGATVDSSATAEKTTTQPQVEQVTVDTTPEAAPVPETINQVTAPAAVTEQTPWTASVVAESPAPVTEQVPWTASVVAEAPAPIVETPAPVAAAPTAVAESVDPLMVDKEKVRAAFEENLEACSAELAYGEQDPIANEYMIEHMAETASCSQARHAAQAARLAKEAAV